jgi:hypothetical protein
LRVCNEQITAAFLTKILPDMKTTILVAFSFLFLLQSLAGQKFTITDKKLKNSFDVNIIKSFSGDTDTSLKLNLSPFGFQRSGKSDCYAFPDSFVVIMQESSHNRKNNNAEEYPGSSIYYAKRHSVMERTYEKSFIIQPDTESKYFLLVKNPLDHRSDR